MRGGGAHAPISVAGRTAGSFVAFFTNYLFVTYNTIVRTNKGVRQERFFIVDHPKRLLLGATVSKVRAASACWDLQRCIRKTPCGFHLTLRVYHDATPTVFTHTPGGD